VVWLPHILSEADHRLNQWNPEPNRAVTRCAAYGSTSHPLDLSDDRLAAVLEALSMTTAGRPLQSGLDPAMVARVRSAARARALGYNHGQRVWRVTEEGPVAVWHSKDHRPTCRRWKVHGGRCGSPGVAGGDGRRAGAASR